MENLAYSINPPRQQCKLDSNAKVGYNPDRSPMNGKDFRTMESLNIIPQEVTYDRKNESTKFRQIDRSRHVDGDCRRNVRLR